MRRMLCKVHFILFLYLRKKHFIFIPDSFSFSAFCVPHHNQGQSTSGHTTSLLLSTNSSFFSLFLYTSYIKTFISLLKSNFILFTVPHSIFSLFLPSKSSILALLCNPSYSLGYLLVFICFI